MQTFLPIDIDTQRLYDSFSASADVLDKRRLNKQILETYQILRALKEPNIENHHRLAYKENRILKAKKLRASRTQGKRPVVRGYVNHSATRMWRGHAPALIMYGVACCESYIRRTGTSHVYYSVYNNAVSFYKPSEFISPKWFNDKNVFASHRSNLLRKDPSYYSKFGWSEPNNLEYVWPV